MRRLRAVLLLSVVSAVGWAFLGALFVIVYLGMQSGAGSVSTGVEAMPMFAFFGFLAGLVYSVALGLSARWAQGRISGIQGAVYGLLGGAVMYFGFLFTVLTQHTGVLMTSFALVGAATGFVMHRVALRASLPPAADVADSLPP